LNLGKILLYLFLSAVALAFIFPLYYMASISISAGDAILSGSVVPTIPPYTYNWYDLFTRFYYVSGMQNSVIITVSSVVVALIASFPTAYAFSRSKFMADKHLFFNFINSRASPAVCFILPFIAMFRGLGLWDTQLGMIIAYMTFNIPLGIWLMISFMGNIPKEIDESAFIDGYSLWGYFRKIFIPLNKPGIAVTAFFVWMFSWAEMFMCSILTSVNAKTLPAQIIITLGRMGYGVEFGKMAAAGVVTMIPGLILIMTARAYIARGFTFGRL